MISNEYSNSEFLINKSRFQYLLDIYKISKKEILSKINFGLKKRIINSKNFEKFITGKKPAKISFLRKIDKIFNKGITWYISQREIPKKASSSIFFRKDKFNTELNLESKKKIAKYEELKFELELLSKNINIKQKRKLPKFKINNNPLEVSRNLREQLNKITLELIEKKYIQKPRNDRDYLRNLMRTLEHLNIFVFEFVDRSRKPENKISFNGFFMSPNIIVIKRQQQFLRREIFTLIHEFAHYLLNIEEVDEDIETNNHQNDIEKWCNDFAYNFLMNGYEKEFSEMEKADASNNFHTEKIRKFHDNTYLSEFALLTRLKIENKISTKDYERIKKDILESIRRKESEDKIRLEEEKNLAEEQGKELFIRGPKEIKSNLFEEIVKINYLSGNIKENKLRELLNIKENKSIEEAIY